VRTDAVGADRPYFVERAQEGTTACLMHELVALVGLRVDAGQEHQPASGKLVGVPLRPPPFSIPVSGGVVRAADPEQFLNDELDDMVA
jgi:hypothetical protein